MHDVDIDFIKTNRKTKLAFIVVVMGFLLFIGSAIVVTLGMHDSMFFSSSDLQNIIIWVFGLFSGANVLQKFSDQWKV